MSGFPSRITAQRPILWDRIPKYPPVGNPAPRIFFLGWKGEGRLLKDER